MVAEAGEGWVHLLEYIKRKDIEIINQLKTKENTKLNLNVKKQCHGTAFIKNSIQFFENRFSLVWFLHVVRRNGQDSPKNGEDLFQLPIFFIFLLLPLLSSGHPGRFVPPWVRLNGEQSEQLHVLQPERLKIQKRSLKAA
jgi:hypothetical protein